MKVVCLCLCLRKREGLVLCMFGGKWHRPVGVFGVSGARSGCKSIYKWKSNELEISTKFLVEISTKFVLHVLFFGLIFGLCD